MYKTLVDPLKEEIEALKEKIRQMDSDINDYKIKLNISNENIVDQTLTIRMYL